VNALIPNPPGFGAGAGSGGLFYDHPRLTFLAIVVVVITGLVSYLTLPRQEDPTMTERWATVKTYVPGASAERVESLVSEPLEAQLREVSEVRQLSSVSRAGFSLLAIELYDEVTTDQVNTVWSEIRDKLTDAEGSLPAAASVPSLEMSRQLATTIVVEISWQDDTPAQMSLLQRMARVLQLRLANLGGTEETDLYGEIDEEILVALNSQATARAGLSLASIATTIGLADTKNTSGRLQAPLGDLLVEVDAELNSAERIGHIPVGTGQNGQTLRLSDIAQVRKFPKDPPSSYALHGNQRVVLVGATMQPGLTIEAWVERARLAVAEFTKDLPPQIGVQVVYDQNEYTAARMTSLGLNLVAALVIVFLVLVWFLGMRAAVTVGIALPLSCGMVLTGMQIIGLPLHQMSVTGLIIALGLLIDNAIVIVDDYKLRVQRGVAIPAAIRTSIRHLLVPLGASTATTVLAFMPIALAGGGVGDFTGSLGITVSLAVCSSFLLALTVVPVIAGYWDRKFPPSRNSRWWHQGWSSPSLAAQYRRSLLFFIRKPIYGLAAGLVLPLIGFALFPTLTNQFFPAVDRNQFQVQIQLPPQASISATRTATETADAVLRSHPEVIDTFWSIGESSPRVYYNAISNGDGIASFAQGWVTTRSAAATRSMLPDLQRKLMRALPAVEIMALPFEQGPPVKAPVELRIVGNDLQVLRRLSEELRRVLASIEGVAYTRALMTGSEPKLVFVPDEQTTAQAGMQTGDISRHLHDSLLGTHAGTVQEGNTALAIRVRLDSAGRDDVDDLTTLPVVSPSGIRVPLDQLGRWTLEPAAASIERFQGERVSSVEGLLIPFTLAAGVLESFTTQLSADGFELPSGYRLEIAGEAEESAESSGSLVGRFMIFALAMVVVITLSMNSFRYTAIIFGVAILSFGLALFGVRLFGYPFGYMALIGGLGMIGIAVNGAIIVLSVLDESPEARQGDDEVTADVVMDATRHILATTVTTMGGFIPLIVSGGQFWPPLATAIAGGAAGSAVIALYTVPALFKWVQRVPVETTVGKLVKTTGHSFV